MEVYFTDHVLERAEEREEIEQTIIHGDRREVQRGRISAIKIFDCQNTGNGKFYAQKSIGYFHRGKTKLIAITVYVFYGSWT
ncbi:MAG: hypothetical protein NZM08_03895 [Chitinophagales bacterium]|nr:hypothetical protein [Chitinophagales bacterium]